MNISYHVLPCVIGVLVCLICFIFEKLKSKNFYVEKFALFRGVFRTNLNVYDGDFCENSKG